ncbi:hypothetical protein Efla_004918 [Eimeria flavescens]
MSRFRRRRPPAGDSTSAAAPQLTEEDDVDVSACEAQEPPASEGAANALGDLKPSLSLQVPSKRGLLPSINEEPLEGQGPPPSLASALFTGNSKYVASPSSVGVGQAGGRPPPAFEAGTPAASPVKGPPPLRLQISSALGGGVELPVHAESLASKARGGGAASLLSSHQLRHATMTRIPAVPRSFLFADEEPNPETAENADKLKGHKPRQVKGSVKALYGRIKALLLQSWGGTVYGMFSEDDLKAFENAMTGFPPSFLDSRMEAHFLRVHSNRVTFYYVALTCFWASFMTVVFGGFLSRMREFRLIWAAPYIVGISTAVALTLAYLVLVGLVSLRRASLRWKLQEAASSPAAEGEAGNQPEGGRADKQAADAAGEQRQAFSAQVFHLRWVVMRDIIIGAMLVLISLVLLMTPAADFAVFWIFSEEKEMEMFSVFFYLREDIFAVFCFFVIFHLACPIRSHTHWLVFGLSLCFFWTNGVLLSVAMKDAATIVPEAIMVTIVLGFACALRSTIERLHRFAFFLRQRSKGIDDAADETLRGVRAFSTTPVEELILLVNAAGLKLRTARKKLRYRKPNELVQAEGMLMRQGSACRRCSRAWWLHAFAADVCRCLMILTARDDLFAFVVDEAAGEHADLRNEVLTAFGANVAFRSVFNESVQQTQPKTFGKKPSSFVVRSSDCAESSCVDSELPPITSIFAASPLDLWSIADNGGREGSWSAEADLKGGRKENGASLSGLMSVLPQPPPPGLLSNLSARIGVEWDLNMLAVNNYCNNCCLFYVGHDLLRYKIEGFSCSSQTMLNFLWAVQLMYQPTIYHGHMHGAQVAHNVVWLARTLDLTDILSPPELVSLVVAALCHDVGHEGRNNAFYTVTNHPLSIIYNDVAILENFHACLTFKILQRTECNIFQELKPSLRMACRGHIVDLILATDMKLHFENISKFKLRRSSPDFDKTQGDDVWCTLRMCMKGGDLSHALLPWEAHLAWSYRAISEFYQQGDEDLAAGREVTPMFDRRKHTELPKGQAGFIRFVVLPLYEEISAVCRSNAIGVFCLALAEENLLNWHKAEAEPRGFQAEDKKQQEGLRIDLALLAAQKAVNRRLSFRVAGHVQIVPPEFANGAAKAAATGSSRPSSVSLQQQQPVGTEKRPTAAAGAGAAAAAESPSEDACNSLAESASSHDAHAAPPPHEVEEAAAVAAEEDAQTARAESGSELAAPANPAGDPSLTPPAAGETAAGSEAAGDGRLWKVGDSYTSIESKLRED